MYHFIINCHVPRANDPGKNKIIMITEKNFTPEKNEFYEYLTISKEFRDDIL